VRPVESRGQLIEVTDRGLYCPAGGFYIDPWRCGPGMRAVITHAHSDHARAGCEAYLCAEPGVGVLRTRLGAAAGPDADDDAPGEAADAGRSAAVQGLRYGERLTIGDVAVSLHPAGHVLGSAQVRVERLSGGGGEDRGKVWVVSGDYKVEADPTCDAFEPVPCHVFITESTFGLPVYRWRPAEEVFDEMARWWLECRQEKVTPVVFCYALGKAQRVIAGAVRAMQRVEGGGQAVPVAAHGAVMKLVEAYRAAGVDLPPVQHAQAAEVKAAAQRGEAMLLVAPPGSDHTPWLRKMGPVSTATASGWMAVRGTRRRRNLERGFVLSDHADWPGLLSAIAATGASRVGVTHGHVDPLVRYLRERGTDAWPVPTRFVGESPQGGEEEERPGPAPEGPPERERR
jgi:putative mRNA 3-end processing factor